MGVEIAVIWEYDPAEDAFLHGRMAAVGLEEHEMENMLQHEPRVGMTTRHVLNEGYIEVCDLESAPPVYLRNDNFLLNLGIRAFQGIRLDANGEPRAVLFIDYRQPQLFTDEDKQQIFRITKTFAQYLKTSRDLHWSKYSSQASREIARVSAEGRLKETLDMIVVQARKLTGCDVVTLYVYDELRSEFIDYASSGDRANRSVLPPEQIGPDFACRRILSLQDKTSYYVVDVRGDMILEGGFTRMEGIRSVAALELRFSEKIVGIMFVNYRHQRKFLDAEKVLLEQFRNQAAVAIYNSLLHEHNRRSTHTLRVLYDAGQTLNGRLWQYKYLKGIYQQVCRQAIEVVGEDPEEDDCISHIMILEGDRLQFSAAAPEHILPRLEEKVGMIDLNSGECMGIVGKAIVHGMTINDGNAPINDEYITYNPEIHSQLSVLISVGKHIIGGLSVEHKKPNAFTPEDEQSVELLASQLGGANSELATIYFTPRPHGNWTFNRK